MWGLVGGCQKTMERWHCARRDQHMTTNMPETHPSRTMSETNLSRKGSGFGVHAALKVWEDVSGSSGVLDSCLLERSMNPPCSTRKTSNTWEEKYLGLLEAAALAASPVSLPAPDLQSLGSPAMQLVQSVLC